MKLGSITLWLTNTLALNESNFLANNLRHRQEPNPIRLLGRRRAEKVMKLLSGHYLAPLTGADEDDRVPANYFTQWLGFSSFSLSPPRHSHRQSNWTAAFESFSWTLSRPVAMLPVFVPDKRSHSYPAPTSHTL